jgi:hypothetical protein
MAGALGEVTMVQGRLFHAMHKAHFPGLQRRNFVAHSELFQDLGMAPWMILGSAASFSFLLWGYKVSEVL